MSAPLPRAAEVRDHAHHAPVGIVRLDYDGRFLRRKVLDLADGGRVLVDLAKTTSLDHGATARSSALGRCLNMLLAMSWWQRSH